MIYHVLKVPVMLLGYGKEHVSKSILQIHTFSSLSNVSTVLTFNSCTKCVGRPGVIHDCTPDSHGVFLGMDA